MRIIDQQIQTMATTAEHHRDRLMRCHPDDEARERELMQAAAAAVEALCNYRNLLGRDHATD